MKIRCLGLLCAGLLAFACTSRAQSRIVFNQGAGGNELWVVNDDGTGLSKLATMPDLVVNPRWSPDGTRIAFKSAGQLWLINADGSNLQSLPLGPQSNSGISWDPTGTEIIFTPVSVCNEHLRISRPDGTNNRLFYDPSTGVTQRPDARPTDTQGLPLVSFTHTQCGQENQPNTFFGMEVSREGGLDLQAISGSPGITRQQFGRWSPDGNLMITAVRNNLANTWALEVLDPLDATAPRNQYAAGLAGFGGVDFGCTTGVAYFSRGGDNFRNLQRLDLDTGTQTQVTSFADGFILDLDHFCANQKPTAHAGGDQIVECAGQDGTAITLDGSASSDPDSGQTLSYTWRDVGNNIVGTGAVVSRTLPLGSHTFTLTVDDGLGGVDSDTVLVTVQDTTPPALTLSTNQLKITVPGPNSTATPDLSTIATASDVCDEFVEINNDAPAEFPVGTTIVIFTATDDSGNASTAELTVQVVYLFTGDFFLHGAGPNNNPSVIFLDNDGPTAGTAKFRDSTVVNFAGGNPWKDIGVWSAPPALATGTLISLGELRVWLGLKNSDDQGTRFDLRTEVYKGTTLIASGETYCIDNLTRNANLAREVGVLFGPTGALPFDGTSDSLTVRILTRIGTDGGGGFCGGHSNAVGLRLYFDSVSRPSRLAASFERP